MVLRQAIRRENVAFGECFGILMSVALEIGFLDPTAHHVEDLAAAEDYVKASVISNNHSACTCAMKPKERGGVANERSIVYGTNNLRIMDASIMPTIPGGNVQSSLYAVAERAADLIIADTWGWYTEGWKLGSQGVFQVQ